MKNLEDMSLGELWELFPIVLKEYNSDYNKIYKEESNKLKNIIGENTIERINHIGSTAIENIISKPIIDILIEINKKINIESLKDKLKENNYILMSEKYSPYFQLSFNKGYTIDGFADKVFHIHIRYLGDPDELYFRDYLIDNIDIRKEYEELKKILANKYRDNRDLYTDKKGEFIKKYSKEAKIAYGDRYKYWG